MNLQSIERLQNLLGRIERNAKLPRTWTQGLGAFAGASAPAPVGVAEQPESLPTNLLEIDISLSQPPAPPAAMDAMPAPAVEAPAVEAPAVEDISLEDVSLEDVSLEEISGVELSGLENEVPSAGEAIDTDGLAETIDADEISVEVTSAPTSEAPREPEAPRAAAANALVTPFTSPPALDELTFSEPPPPASEPTAAEVEPPPISAAQAVSEPPDSIDAALLAATEAHAASVRQQEQTELEEIGDEGPVLTPPPESGPQVAMPPLAAPAMPARQRDVAPTIEQLGDVIELEQASGPPLELAAPASEPATVALKAHEELEFVPRTPEPSRPLEGREPLQTLVGGFTEDADPDEFAAPDTDPPPARPVAPVTHAQETDEASMLEVPVSGAAPKAALPMVTSVDAVTFGEEAPTASSLLAPEVVARAPIAAARPIVDVIAAARAYRPASFLELLDASIRLLK